MLQTPADGRLPPIGVRSDGISCWFGHFAPSCWWMKPMVRKVSAWVTRDMREFLDYLVNIAVSKPIVEDAKMRLLSLILHVTTTVLDRCFPYNKP